MFYISRVLSDIVRKNRKDIKTQSVFYIHRVMFDYVKHNRTTRSRTENIVFFIKKSDFYKMKKYFFEKMKNYVFHVKSFYNNSLLFLMS